MLFPSLPLQVFQNPTRWVILSQGFWIVGSSNFNASNSISELGSRAVNNQAPPRDGLSEMKPENYVPHCVFGPHQSDGDYHLFQYFKAYLEEDEQDLTNVNWYENFNNDSTTILGSQHPVASSPAKSALSERVSCWSCQPSKPNGLFPFIALTCLSRKDWWAGSHPGDSRISLTIVSSMVAAWAVLNNIGEFTKSNFRTLYLAVKYDKRLIWLSSCGLGLLHQLAFSYC